jgi:uncharacterized membrane protein
MALTKSCPRRQRAFPVRSLCISLFSAMYSRMIALHHHVGVALIVLASACSSSATAPQLGADASLSSDASVLAEASASSDASGAEDGSPTNDAAALDVMGVDAAACGSKPTTGDFPADVAAVLQAKCQTCHKMPPINHAPFPLLTFADTLAIDPLQPYMGAPIWEAMSYVIQPGAVPHMPFGSAPQLTSAEYQTLYAWLFSCALPAPAGADGGEGMGSDSSSDASTD